MIDNPSILIVLVSHCPIYLSHKIQCSITNPYPSLEGQRIYPLKQGLSSNVVRLNTTLGVLEGMKGTKCVRVIRVVRAVRVVRVLEMEVKSKIH